MDICENLFILPVVVYAILKKETDGLYYQGKITDSMCYQGKKTDSIFYEGKKT